MTPTVLPKIGAAAVSIAAVLGAIFGGLALFMPDIGERIDYATRQSAEHPLEDLIQGDCVRETESSLTDPAFPNSRTPRASFSLVKCSDPHDRQVVAVLTRAGNLDESAPEDEVWRKMCLDSFSTNVRVDIEAPSLEWNAPTVASWQAGDRLVICFATSPTGLIESVLR